MGELVLNINPTVIERLKRVFDLADELTGAIDMAAEDIGGHRPIKTILQELGPACDAARQAMFSATENR